MKRVLSFTTLFLFAGVILGLVSAQDTTTATAPDGSLKFDYPADWELNTDAGITLTDGSATITIFTPDDIAALAPDAASASDALNALADDQGLESPDVTSVTNADRTILSATTSDQTIMLTEIDDGRYAALLADTSTDGRLLRTVVDSFRVSGKNIAVTINLTPCTVRTEEARSVHVHVGPGTNRTSIVFLPPGEDFTVLGQSTANDGGVWWKLDKDQVAPSSSASELWVAETDVAESGDCDAVIDAAAPPIIPIVRQQPTPSGGGGGAATTDTGSGAELTSGRWTLTPVRVYLSCVGTATYNLTPAEFGLYPASGSVSLSADKATLNFDGFPMNRTGGADYFGYVMYGGDSVQLFLTIESPTQMSGRVVYTLDVNGVACSATALVTVSHN